MMRRVRFVLGATTLVLSLVLVGCGAIQKSPEKPEGVSGLKPTVEDEDAGLVGLAPGFELSKYQVIAVSRFPAPGARMKDDEDREIVSTLPVYFQAELLQRLRATGLFTRVVDLSGAQLALGARDTLRLEGTITQLDRGSQAARYWGGLFGAGATEVEVETRFVDLGTGQVVLVTADRREASIGMFGGEAKDHIRESFDDMARDLANFLVRLSKGEAPKK